MRRPAPHPNRPTGQRPREAPVPQAAARKAAAPSRERPHSASPRTAARTVNGGRSAGRTEEPPSPEGQYAP